MFGRADYECMPQNVPREKITSAECVICLRTVNRYSVNNVRLYIRSPEKKDRLAASSGSGGVGGPFLLKIG